MAQVGALFRRSSGASSIVASTEDVFLRMIGAVRRLLSLALAFCVAAGPLAAAGGAMGRDNRDERGRGEPARGRGEEGRGPVGRQGPPGWRGEERGGGRWERADPRYERGDPRGDPRGEPDPRAYGQLEIGREGGYGPAPRRGGFLSQGGPVIDDYSRYRLRAPPRGFHWVRTPGGMALVHRDSGRVYDVVPY